MNLSVPVEFKNVRKNGHFFSVANIRQTCSLRSDFIVYIYFKDIYAMPFSPLFFCDASGQPGIMIMRGK